MSIFDEEGLIRESYALAKTALVHYGTKGSQYATIDAVAGGLVLFFLASNMAYSNHGRTITKRDDVEQYACLPLLSKCLRLFFPTPKPVSIVCTDAALKNLPASIGGLARLRTIVVRGNNLIKPMITGYKDSAGPDARPARGGPLWALLLALAIAGVTVWVADGGLLPPPPPPAPVPAW